eukprot:2538805-Prymnesium_polylepis.1
MTRPCKAWSAITACSAAAVAGERKACAASERRTSCDANGCCGSCQANSRRRYSSTTGTISNNRPPCLTAACAIVPAYPNELTPPACVSSAASSVLLSLIHI